jgi:hypothetical protein
MIATYSAIRPLLRTGDVYFSWGTGFLARTIIRKTGGPSHVGLVWLAGDRVMLVHSDENGVHIDPLSKLVRDDAGGKLDRGGKKAFKRHTRATPEQLAAIGNFAVDRAAAGVRYDFLELPRIWARINLHRLFGARFAPRSNDRDICSEHVYRAYASQGIVLPYNPAGYIAPADIWNCEELEMVAVAA